MPIGEGYWLNSRTGDDIEVFEHAKHVIENPELFGLQPQAVAGKEGAMYAQDPELRRNLLIDVMKRGWIRVRSHRGRNVFETAHVNDDVLYSVLEFAQKHNMWDNETLLISDVTKPEGYGVTQLSVGQLQKQFGMAEQLADVRTGSHSLVEVWTNVVDDDVVKESIRECVRGNLHLIVDPVQVPWLMRESKDNLGQLKIEVALFNHNMYTGEELEAVPLVDIKTPTEHLTKIAESLSHATGLSFNHYHAGLVSSGDLEVTVKTTSRI